MAPNLAALVVAKRNQDSKKGAAMNETTPSPPESRATSRPQRGQRHHD